MVGGDLVMKKVAHSLEVRIVTKKEAAQRQIDVAINLLPEREYESAITLACAAEGQMAKTADHPHLFAVLQQKRPATFATANEWVTCLNETRDWLKHPTPQLGDKRGMAEYEAWVMLVRAVGKYYAVFREDTDNMNRFVEWSKARGLPQFKKFADPPVQ
jgi:hypothetical protein